LRTATGISAAATIAGPAAGHALPAAQPVPAASGWQGCPV